VIQRKNSGVKGHLNAILAGLRALLRNPITLRYPEVVEERPEGYRGIVLYDYSKCIGCSLCAQICPARAIKMYRVPGDKRLRPGYNLSRCIFCGFCVDVCPTEALMHSKVHDTAYLSIENLDLDPADWVKLSNELKKAKIAEGKTVKVRIDERRGIVYG